METQEQKQDEGAQNAGQYDKTDVEDYILVVTHNKMMTLKMSIICHL